MTPSISPSAVEEKEEKIEPDSADEGVPEATNVLHPKEEALSPMLCPLQAPVAAAVVGTAAQVKSMKADCRRSQTPYQTNDTDNVLADDLDIGASLQQDVPALLPPQTEARDASIDRLMSPFELLPLHDDDVDMSSGCSPAPAQASPPKFVRPADILSLLGSSDARPAIGAVVNDSDGSEDELL